MKDSHYLGEWAYIQLPLKDKMRLALDFLQQKLGNPLIKLEIWKWAIYPEGKNYENYDDDAPYDKD